jgi:AraC-like DNA-binding protein
LQVSDDDRDMVEAALARGWSNQRIADALGISVPSLKRYFRPTLAQRNVMQDRLELAANARLIRAALEGGNMSAMKQLRDLLDRDGLTRHKRKLEEQQQEAKASGIGMGKKEAAQRAAEDSIKSDGWGDLLDPNMLN